MSRRNESPGARQKKGKRKRSRTKFLNKRFVLFVTITFVLLYFLLFRGIPFLISSNASTVTAVVESYVDEEDAKALIIRDEYVQEVGTKNLKFKVKDGEKVAKDQIIATASISPGSEEKGEIDSYDDEIKNYQDLFDNYKYYAELDNIDETELNDYMTKLKESFPEDTESVEKIKEDIVSGTVQNADFFQKKIDSLEKKIENTKEKSGTGPIDYRAEVTGIFCHSTDGFEKTLPVKDLKDIGVEKFDQIIADVGKANIKPSVLKKLFKKDNEEPAATKVKIIDNSSWYALVKTNIDYKRYIDGKDYVNFKIESKDLKLPGKVINIKEEDREMLILLEFDSSLHDVYDIRETDVKLEKAKYNGLKVPKSAIAQKSNQQGVYIKDVNGIVKFVPVNLDYIDSKNAIVRIEPGGNIKATIDGEVQDRKALSVYDEVIKNGSLAKENTILN